MAPTNVASELDYAAFVDAMSAELLRYATRNLRGSGLDPEDALQEGLARIWREWDGWPTDPADRRRYAYTTLKRAAQDARRKWDGRGARENAETPVDFAALDRRGDAYDHFSALEGETARAIADAPIAHGDPTAAIERLALRDAFDALEPVEIEVLLGTGIEGKKAPDLADELGITPAHVHQLVFRARRILQGLLVHASGVDLTAEDHDYLRQYADGELRGRDRTIAQRHIDNCPRCRQVIELEHGVMRRAAAALAPLPMLGLKPLTAATTAAATGAAGGATGLGGAGLATATGASGGAAATGGGFLAGLSGKAAAIAATAAVVGGGAGAAQVLDAPPRERPAAVAQSQQPRPHTTSSRRPQTYRLVDQLPKPAAPKPASHRRAKPRPAAAPANQSATPQPVPAPQPQPAPAPQPAAAPQPAPAARTQPRVAQPASPAPQPSKTSGGEFVIGNGTP